ncbi:hypothetical protein CC85DRAFT_285681 [Cutaneotrichosporon oleaginosum]|uniref:Uncharacterized protein n=1 Tax=Cutaneotrichosporon oleaginosum TaxID=879819 RepID=A0A0J0XMA7_9TREE|nr:uncharacterized protein CC85DRAFT_285681 [Cutaneotrichosporon oleaginosum]KLT42275.1 hypothetical protein CC85DRAFT_285681 [Cutaneotrichosporon oleaginosum]TXT11447.1 hypothetical protein COLE_01857 [Cutaneotrichosporon oleaginosum]
MSDPPLNLAGVPHVDDALIDPQLAAEAFFDGKFDPDLAAAAVAAAQPQYSGGDFQIGVDVNVGVPNMQGIGVDIAQPILNGGLDGQPAPPQAHAHQSQAQNQSQNSNHEMQHQNQTQNQNQSQGQNAPTEGVHVPVSVNMSASHMAPFSRPHRDDSTAHPELLSFTNRAEFDVWFEGESSWCHFVQRRTTTPEKRAEERLRARIKAHERMLATMSPEEAASAPPLKRRRRNRTSNIKEKVTFTCHHAGRYEAKHSTTLPREKLRLNTKKSVKCDCPARIVLTELDEGECKVSYFWRHEGHDAYADDELESGRLPKVIDEWLVAQIQAGKDTDEIRRALMMPEDEKQAYLRQIAEDPASVDPAKPPPLALTLRIKYPDIYNRYRKLKGPIKEFKPPKHPRARKRTDEKDMDLATNMSNGLTNGLDMANGMDGVDPGPSYQLNADNMVDGFAALREAIDNNISDPFGGHEHLERALLALPRGVDQNDDTELSDAMMRMAEAQQSDDKSREVWAGVGLE